MGPGEADAPRLLQRQKGCLQGGLGFGVVVSLVQLFAPFAVRLCRRGTQSPGAPTQIEKSRLGVLLALLLLLGIASMAKYLFWRRA